MKSQALFDAMSAAVKSKGPELVKMGGAATCLQVNILCSDPAMPPQCPCNSRALERNEKEWALSSLWRCLNAQIPIQWYLMQVDSVWPRCSSSSSATLVRRASSSLIWRTAVVLRKRVKKPARSAAKFQQNHCYHRCSLHILRFDMIWHDLTSLQVT